MAGHRCVIRHDDPVRLVKIPASDTSDIEVASDHGFDARRPILFEEEHVISGANTSRTRLPSIKKRWSPMLAWEVRSTHPPAGYVTSSISGLVSDRTAHSP